MKLSFLEEALGEYDAAVDYYIDNNEVVTRRFVAEFEFGVEAILANPSRWRKEGESARIYRMPNFPYSLIYRVVEEEVILIALAHHRRRPGYWQKR